MNDFMVCQLNEIRACFIFIQLKTSQTNVKTPLRNVFYVFLSQQLCLE